MKPIGLLFSFAWLLATAVSSPNKHRCGNWKELTQIPTGPVQEHGVAATDHEIYVIGGIPVNATAPFFLSRRESQAFNIKSKTWRRIADLPTGITHPNVAGVGDAIYVLGGLTDNGKDPYWNYTTACYVYRPLVGKWFRLPPVPDRFARGAAVVAVHGTKILLAGGMTSFNLSLGGGGRPTGRPVSTKLVTSYDTRTGVWMSLRPLPEPRDHAGGAVRNKKFYVMGGRDNGVGSEKQQVWALQLDKWKANWVAKKNMPEPRAGFAVGTHLRKIQVFGGEGNKDSITGVYETTFTYNVHSDVWKRVKDMTVPRHGLGAVTFRKSTWMAGGGLMTGIVKPDAHLSRFTEEGYTLKGVNASDLPHGCLGHDPRDEDEA